MAAEVPYDPFVASEGGYDPCNPLYEPNDVAKPISNASISLLLEGLANAFTTPGTQPPPPPLLPPHFEDRRLYQAPHQHQQHRQFPLQPPPVLPTFEEYCQYVTLYRKHYLQMASEPGTEEKIDWKRLPVRERSPTREREPSFKRQRRSRSRSPKLYREKSPARRQQCRQQEQQQHDKYMLFVCNIPFTTSEETLRTLFESRGTTLKSFKIIDNTGRDGRVSKRFAFVSFHTESELQEGLKFHDYQIDDRKLLVRVSEKNPPRNLKQKTNNSRLSCDDNLSYSSSPFVHCPATDLRPKTFHECRDPERTHDYGLGGLYRRGTGTDGFQII
jgi:hypothetical protein